MQHNGTGDQTDKFPLSHGGNEWLQNGPEIRHRDRACKQGHQYSGAKDAGIGMNEADNTNMSSQHHLIKPRGNITHLEIPEHPEDLSESEFSDSTGSIDGDEGAHDHTITDENENLANLNRCYLSIAHHGECNCHLVVWRRPYATSPRRYASPYASGIHTPTSTYPEQGSNEHSLAASIVLSSRSMSSRSLSTRSMSTTSFLPFVGHHFRPTAVDYFITNPLRLTQGADVPYPYPVELNIDGNSDHDVEDHVD